MHSPKCLGLDKALHTWHIVHGLMSDGPEGCVFIMGRCVDGTPADWTVIGVHTSGSYSFEAHGQHNMCNHFTLISCMCIVQTDTQHNSASRHQAPDRLWKPEKKCVTELIGYQGPLPLLPAISPQMYVTSSSSSSSQSLIPMLHRQ